MCDTIADCRWNLAWDIFSIAVSGEPMPENEVLIEKDENLSAILVSPSCAVCEAIEASS